MDQAVQEKNKPASYKTDAASASTDRTFFKMRAPLLDEGRSNHPLAKTKNMWATLKVYASGGENGLHTHPNEDHLFVVMQGSARYYDAEGGHRDVARHEGIMLPAGAYYYFHATSEEPLVLMRVGCRVSERDASGRLNIRGEDMPGDSPENKQVPVKVKEGVFFE